jgi:uncharacterized protein YprB with RNaseH-like and TPR domain
VDRSISDRLKALGVKVDRPSPSAHRPARPHPIEDVVPGSLQRTPHGDAFVVERQYPLGHRQGRYPLAAEVPPPVIAQWACDPRLARAGTDAIVFLDTETTGLARGAGTYAFLICVGRFEAHGFRLLQFFMRDPAEESAMLAALSRALFPGDVLVTFNGKTFDVPLLNARYVLSACAGGAGSSPVVDRPHLDLLPLARRLWRDRLPSRALSYLEEHILGVERTEEDVPGWMIPELYFDYLRSGDGRPLERVFYHNAMDVLSLATLLHHVGEILQDPLNSDQVHTLDLVAMAKLFEDLGHLDTAVALYRQGLGHDLPEGLYWRAVRRLSSAYKRRGEWAAAVGLWHEAARDGQLYAHLQLAKYYEHQERNYPGAAWWTQLALDRVAEPGFSGANREQWQSDLEHRLARVRRKLADADGSDIMRG